MIARALARTEEVFERLGAYSYLSTLDKGDFSYYRAFYTESLLEIDSRISDGVLRPVDLSDFPQVVRFPGYDINAALFIGSFDPFQMTHLATALRFLASPGSSAPVVFVVPEGHDNPRKPRKSDYRYRFELLSMQVLGVFDPLIVPLDIGEGADTIEIVRRFIAMFPGAKVSMTHLLGSDVLPMAASMLPVDMKAWRAEAEARRVDFSYKAFVVIREGSPSPEPHAVSVRKLGLPIYVDETTIGAPSSSDFRENRAFSIVFPTESVIRHVEVLFRYNLNKPWSVCGLGDGPPKKGATRNRLRLL
ncbi:MAG: hypothetical protein CVV47_00210 [Spirochaetae bacterium HGW-Spirochaetae-3]|jgi:hypothetical protein|nr:MAG: hypothetical protein CVV47_00210 [Spirochaetae bacterium HGW-Spirochaetae-3]